MFSRFYKNRRRSSGAGLPGRSRGFRRQTTGVSHAQNQLAVLKPKKNIRKSVATFVLGNGKNRLPAPMVPPQQLIDQQERELLKKSSSMERMSSTNLLKNSNNKLLEFKTDETEEFNRIFEKLLDAEAAKLVIKVGNYLTDLVGSHEMETKMEQLSQESVSFQGNSIPKIQLSFYICRIVELINDEADEAKSSLDSIAIKQLLMAVVYIKRILKKHEDFKFTYLNIHRMVLSCFVLAAKIIDDESPSNLTFSYIGGLQLDEINKLEGAFVKTIDFELHISRKQLQRQYKKYADGYKMRELM